MTRAIIIGAGITGAGIARDLALRGIQVTLIERSAPAAGATGRCHGLLHSGARYAVKDPVSARECAEENLVLKDIASYCIDDMGGVFLAVTESDVSYGDALVDSCKRARIPVEDVTPCESPNPGALRCIRTNDARIDPFLLDLANIYDACLQGTDVRIGTGVKSIGNGWVTLEDNSTLRADVIINATGYECGNLLSSSGRHGLAVQPNKGTILVTERRVCDVVVNRMRPPSNGDIIVPCHTTSLIGTTSSNSVSMVPTRQEYRELMRETIALMPSIKGCRIIRAFSGIRPLLGSGDGRDLSRDYKVFEDEGIITVAGGKLTTYRLIAEKVSDAAMRMLGEKGKCMTRSPLPDILSDSAGRNTLCYCENAKNRLMEMNFLKGLDRAKFNRLGFGACQGMRCSKNTGSVEEFLQERWKGMKPVIDDGQIQQAYLSWATYKSRIDFKKY